MVWCRCHAIQSPYLPGTLLIFSIFLCSAALLSIITPKSRLMGRTVQDDVRCMQRYTLFFMNCIPPRIWHGFRGCVPH